MIKFIKYCKRCRWDKYYWYIFTMEPDGYKALGFTTYTKAKLAFKVSYILGYFSPASWEKDFGPAFNNLTFNQIYEANVKCFTKKGS